MSIIAGLTASETTIAQNMFRRSKSGVFEDCNTSRGCCCSHTGGRATDICMPVWGAFAAVVAFVGAIHQVESAMQSQRDITTLLSSQEAQGQEARQSLVRVLKEQHVSESIHATSWSIATISLGVLTAAAVLSLYIYIKHVGFSGSYGPLLAKLGISGGAGIGGALLLMGTYAGVRRCCYKDVMAERQQLQIALSSTHTS